MLMFKLCHFLSYPNLRKFPINLFHTWHRSGVPRMARDRITVYSSFYCSKTHCSWFACFCKLFNRIFKNPSFERGSVQSRVIPLGLFLTWQEEHNSAKKGEQDSCNSILWWYALKKRDTRFHVHMKRHTAFTNFKTRQSSKQNKMLFLTNI